MSAARRAALAAAATLGGLFAFTLASGARARALVPPDGRLLEVDRRRVHVRDRGQGPAIVMIHGLGGQMRNFSYALAALLEPHFRVVLIDRPGSGWSAAAPGSTPTIAGQAAIVSRVIEQLGLERPLVVGHSLGGAVALALALDHPHRVGGLALIAPLTSAPDEVPAAFRSLLIRSRALRLAVAYTIAVPGMMALSARRRNLIFAPEAEPDDFAERGGGVLLQQGGTLAAASSDIATAHEQMTALAARYPSLDLPVDVLFGRDDRVVPPAENGEAFVARVPGARLELCDGGHMLPVTQPALVADWLRRAHERRG